MTTRAVCQIFEHRHEFVEARREYQRIIKEKKDKFKEEERLTQQINRSKLFLKSLLGLLVIIASCQHGGSNSDFSLFSFEVINQSIRCAYRRRKLPSRKVLIYR